MSFTIILKFPVQILKNHLGLVFDNKLNFKKHFKDKLNKAYFWCW